MVKKKREERKKNFVVEILSSFSFFFSKINSIYTFSDGEKFKLRTNKVTSIIRCSRYIYNNNNCDDDKWLSLYEKYINILISDYLKYIINLFLKFLTDYFFNMLRILSSIRSSSNRKSKERRLK